MGDDRLLSCLLGAVQSWPLRQCGMSPIVDLHRQRASVKQQFSIILTDAILVSKRNGRSEAIDRELGAKLRAVRIFLCVSQAELGMAIGISSQQIQNYELGRYRIAASTLQVLGNALGVHPGLFFLLDMPAPSGGIADLRSAMRMAAAVQRISSVSQRERLSIAIDKICQESLPG